MDGIVMTEVYAGFYELIGERRYDLEDVLHRIDVMYAAGRLTDGEREELYALARENAKAQYDYATEIEAIWAAIRALQASVGGSSGESSGGSSGEADEWPAYQQPTGAHDAYYTGDQITYNGKHYICKMDGCVWPPDAYPAGWEEQQ